MPTVEPEVMKAAAASAVVTLARNLGQPMRWRSISMMMILSPRIVGAARRGEFALDQPVAEL